MYGRPPCLAGVSSSEAQTGCFALTCCITRFCSPWNHLRSLYQASRALQQGGRAIISCQRHWAKAAAGRGSCSAQKGRAGEGQAAGLPVQPVIHGTLISALHGTTSSQQASNTQTMLIMVLRCCPPPLLSEVIPTVGPRALTPPTRSAPPPLQGKNLSNAVGKCLKHAPQRRSH